MTRKESVGVDDEVGEDTLSTRVGRLSFHRVGFHVYDLNDQSSPADWTLFRPGGHVGPFKVSGTDPRCRFPLVVTLL